MDFQEYLREYFPVLFTLATIISIFGGTLIFFNDLKTILGESILLYLLFFLFGVLITELFHHLKNTVFSLKSYLKIAILHSSFENRIQLSPIQEMFTNTKIKFIEFHFDKFKLWDDKLADWDSAKIYLQQKFRRLIKNLSVQSEIHYFGHASVPLSILFGYLFSLRYQIKVHHHKKKESDKPWEWELTRKPKDWEITVNPSNWKENNSKEVAIVVHQSYMILEDQIFETINHIPLINVSVPDPNDLDLKSEKQAYELASEVRYILDNLTSARIVHLFCAILSPTSFLIGQNISPNSHPTIKLYHYNKGSTPPYKEVYTIN